MPVMPALGRWKEGQELKGILSYTRSSELAWGMRDFDGNQGHMRLRKSVCKLCSCLAPALIHVCVATCAQSEAVKRLRSHQVLAANFQDPDQLRFCFVFPSSSKTHSIAQTGLKLKAISCLSLYSIGITGVSHGVQLSRFFINKWHVHLNAR